MGLSKYKIGDLINFIDEKNIDGKIKDFCGININKEFMPTIANTDNLDNKKYKIVCKNRFVFSGMQTGRDECIRISLYNEQNPVLISPAYTTFEIKTKDIILPEYFFMIFLRTEMDRFGWFLSDSSVRANLDLDVFCNIELELPSIEIQQKYVDVYNALLRNQQAYEKGLDDLKLTCDAYVEKLKNEINLTPTGNYIEQTYERNTNLTFNFKNVKGMTITKEITPTKADVKNTNLSNFLIVKKGEFVYNPRTHGEKIGMGFNNTEEPFIISWNNTAFKVKDTSIALPEYLFMLFCREEWDRQACYNSWGSSTVVFTWESLCNVKIPIPDIKIQQAIVDIYIAYQLRQEINKQLKIQIKEICPILIKGALEEGAKS